MIRAFGADDVVCPVITLCPAGPRECSRYDRENTLIPWDRAPAFATQCPPSDQNTACNYPPATDTFSITTDTAPAAAGRKDNLFVFVRAGDGRILFNQAAPGAAFVGWQEIAGGVITDAALGASMRAIRCLSSPRAWTDGSSSTRPRPEGPSSVGRLNRHPAR
jgi:hypothetical protein